MEQININELFESIGLHTFLQDKLEKQVVQLQKKIEELKKSNDELQKTLKQKIEDV